MSEALKPCPFCGGEAVIKEDRNNGLVEFFITCESCSASTTLWMSEPRAIQAWNTRPTLAPALQALELRKALEMVEPFQVHMSQLLDVLLRGSQEAKSEAWMAAIEMSLGLKLGVAVKAALTLPLSAAELKVKAMEEVVEAAKVLFDAIYRDINVTKKGRSTELERDIAYQKLGEALGIFGTGALSALNEGEVKP